MIKHAVGKIGLVAAVVMLVTFVVNPVTAAGASPAPGAHAATALVSGQVFGDANANGRADAGEGLTGVKVELDNTDESLQQPTLTATTGRGGRFSTSVPPGSYYLSGSGGGWHLFFRVLHLKTGSNQLSLRAVRPLDKVLKASIEFTRKSYRPHATVHLRVTITNTGSGNLRGISPECDHVGDPDELANNTKGWGKLQAEGAGVLLAAHQTRIFAVTAKVPPKAEQSGQVFVECDFGYPELYAGYRPQVDARAAVPGESGVLTGQVQYYPDGHNGAAVGVDHVRIVLADPNTCPVFTRTATTDAAGNFRLTAPAGKSYELYGYPPKGFKLRYGNPTNAFVFGDDTTDISPEVARGSAKAPALPTCTKSPAAGPPSASPGTAALADTGVSSADLGVLAGLAIAAGLGLTACTQPRRHRRSR